ncbi:MAG: DUF2007 domain-containing protein [Nitrospirae bacterium]|nr:DUF2007 domain-containing protein [Nitrospirota bacterium]
MFCPECRTEYVPGIQLCTDCSVALVAELPPLPQPEFSKYHKLYTPRNASELALIESILEAEKIDYFVKNDNFGSLYIGPQIDLYNQKTIMVQDDQYDRAKDVMSDYLQQTEVIDEKPLGKYTLFDKLRIVAEFLMFGWVIPGRKKDKFKA